MNNDKLFKNAELAGADISMFHAPDHKWKNYYYEDEEQDLLFLLPSYLFYGPIVVNLSWARFAKFTTEDGVIHMFKDYTWNMTSNNRRTSYVKTAVTDRSVKCGRKTIILSLLVLNRLFTKESEVKNAVLYINGNTLDNRIDNLHYGALKENNNKKHAFISLEVKYPCKKWW